jgi:hypothetical protein
MFIIKSIIRSRKNPRALTRSSQERYSLTYSNERAQAFRQCALGVEVDGRSIDCLCAKTFEIKRGLLKLQPIEGLILGFSTINFLSSRALIHCPVGGRLITQILFI